MSGQSSVDYSYTPQGQVAARAISLSNGPVYALGYGYDAMGRLTELQYPDGNEAFYDYSRGAVADVRLKVGSSNVYGVTGVSYLPMDLAMSGWASNNGLSNTLGYDGDARLTGITVPGVASLGFSYDADNRITHIANGIDNSLTQSLGYDTLGRLQSEASAVQNATYGYDADGNRVAQTLNGARTSFSYASNSNRLASASGGLNATYGYDADGNTTTVNGLTAYSYGPFNRLVNAGGTHYVVSAEGQRLERSGGGNITYFAPGGGGAMLAEDDNGTWMDYVWLNGRLVSLVKNGSVYSIHDDQTGRPIAVTAPNQAIVWSAAGLPFDRQITANTFGDFNIGFPGQYFDSETGLYQNGARDYDAALGRYIESDPIGLAGGVNTYAYVGNNPISNIDPLGLRPLTGCEKRKLSPYVPQVDLNNADIHDGEQPWWLPDKKHNIGVTVYNDIYFRAGAYNPGTPGGLALLAHELYHVGQYRKGILTIPRYLLEAARHGSGMNNKYESPAYNFEAEVYNDLISHGTGGCECGK